MRALAGMVAVAIAGTLGTTAASAQEDANAYRTISGGDYAGAARLLEEQRRVYPARPELMLNLAAAYHRLGRVAEAQALYRQVLARPTINMDMPDGTVVPSHALAEMGLARIQPAIASR